MQITSLQNPRIKAAARLRDRAGRDDQQRIIIDGIREISRAANAGVTIVELYYVADRCGAHHEEALAAAKKSHADLFEVTPPLLDKLAFGQRHEGLVAVAIPPRRSLDDLTLTTDSLVAVVEGAEKPGNLGAILRTADAAGVSAVIAADGGTDLFNPNAIRASLGAIFTIPYYATTSQSALAWLQKNKFRVYAARVDGTIEYIRADFRGRTALLLGSEARGLTDHWRSPDITPIRLPLLGTVDSLNLSATAAVLFYEALRQRQPPVV